MGMRAKTFLYADYQATTPVDPHVLSAMEPYWKDSFGNPHSHDHIVGWRAEQATRAAAASVAALFGADDDEIIFTSGATESNNLALLGLARHSSNQKKRILISAIEHKCMLAAARALVKRESFTAELIPVNSNGMVDLEVLNGLLGDDVLLVSLIPVNNEIGVIQDVESVAKLLADFGIPLHLDAAQAPCAMNLDGLTRHADLISLSGHKMYGPQGIGALYIRRELQERIEPVIYGGGQQQGLRSGTLPLPLCVGMGAAASLCATDGAAQERERIGRQRDTFVRLLKEGSATIVVNGPKKEKRHPGNANVRFEGYSAQDILGVLQPNLAASTGSACTSGTPEPSHVLRALGLSLSESEASIRFSFGRFTTDEEIELAADLVLEALTRLARISRPQSAAA